MFTVRSLNICEVPSHLSNVLRNVYVKKCIDCEWERICLRILVPGTVIAGMWPHSVIGYIMQLISTDAMYQLRSNL